MSRGALGRQVVEGMAGSATCLALLRHCSLLCPWFSLPSCSSILEFMFQQDQEKDYRHKRKESFSHLRKVRDKKAVKNILLV